MKLIAKKPCSFGGSKFYIGDEIPAEYVLDYKVQEKRGVVACVSEEKEMVQDPPMPPEQAPITITIDAQEGDVELTPTLEGLQSVFDVLNSTVDEAESIVKQMVDGDALLLLYESDNRKSIKSAAQDRAEELFPSSEEADSEEAGEE